MKSYIKLFLIASFFLFIILSSDFILAEVLPSNFTLNTPININRSQNTTINFAVGVGNSSVGGGVGQLLINASQVVFTITQGTATFVTGSNSTTAVNTVFTNISATTMVFSNITGEDGIINGTAIRNFSFQINPTSTGTLQILVNVTGNSTSFSNTTTQTFRVDFAFSGYVKNETGGIVPNANVSIYRFMQIPAGPPTESIEKTVLTDANGMFVFPNINSSATNYKLKIIKYGIQGSGCGDNANSTCNATKVSSVLPPFPANMYYPQSSDFDMSLNGSIFYLQPAATLRLYANNESNRQRFGYEVIDQKVGFPVESNIRQNVTTADIIVPSGRDYSVMFVRMPGIFKDNPTEFSCITGASYNDSYCSSLPMTNSSLGTINAGDILTVNQSLVMTKNRLYGCINVAPGHNDTNLNVTNIRVKIIPFKTSTGHFIPSMNAGISDLNNSMHKAVLNLSNMSDWSSAINGINTSIGSLQCPGSLAAYNFSVLGSSSGINYLIEVYAKNHSNDAIEVYNNNQKVLAAFKNVTITDNTMLNLTLEDLVGNYYNTTITASWANTSQMKINIQNKSGSPITTNMHVEVEVKNTNIDPKNTLHFMIETLSNGTFYIPILNNSNWTEVSIFPNDGPPLVKMLNLSTYENNITLVSIDFAGGGDKGLRRMNSTGGLEAIDVSAIPFTLRFLRRGTNEVITEMGANNFNPLKALVAGNIDLEIKVNATNVTMRFNNFDMFSAKQPPMFAIIDNRSMNSTTSQRWNFGNFVPKEVYDNVTITIPYSAEVNESYTYNISIPALYSEDLRPEMAHQFSTAWNLTSGDTLGSLPDEFLEYNVSRYNRFLTSAGEECSKTNTSHSCFMNTTTNQIIMEIPHFSGLNPSSAGSYNTPTAAASTSGGGGSPSYWSKTVVVDEADFTEGYTKDLKKKERIKVDIEGDTHYIGVVDIASSTVTINISSETIQATLSVGDERKFDVSADGYYDLYVKLNSISSNKADLTIKSINEKVTEESEAQEQEKQQAAEEEQQTPITTEEEKSLAWLWILVIIVVVIAIAIAVGIGMKKGRRF